MNKNEICAEILGSKKYANIDPSIVERLCEETIPKYPKRKDVVKAIKKELHIIHESFLGEDCHQRATSLISNYSGSDLSSDKELTLKLLELHSSTKERLTQVDEIYSFISEYISLENDVIDLGCGFNPLVLPFFETKPKNYTALDINQATIELLNYYFEQCKLPYQAGLCDAVGKTNEKQADILLLFKLFPLLERQKKGQAFEIIRSYNCKRYIISFPLKSASGKEKGMEKYYTDFFEQGLPTYFSIKEKKIFDNEMFYIVLPTKELND